jgi:hypothetical protein
MLEVRTCQEALNPFINVFFKSATKVKFAFVEIVPETYTREGTR